MLLCIDDILAFVSILQFSRNAQEFDDKNAFDTTLKKLKKYPKNLDFSFPACYYFLTHSFVIMKGLDNQMVYRGAKRTCNYLCKWQ